MQSTRAGGRAEAARWQGALDLLRLVRRQPGITRAAAARTLQLSSGSTTEITARLRQLRLIEERPAPPAGRGRPTTALHASPEGPVAAVINIRHEDWQVMAADLEGKLVAHGGGPHPDPDPGQLIGAVRTALARVRRRYRDRLRVVSVAVAGTISHGRLVQASTLGWQEVDLAAIMPASAPPLPLLIGNNATLAGVAEARRGTGAATRTMLYLTIEVGVGGVFLAEGRPVTGNTGAGGEFGHLPFGESDLACPCGAYGCWDLVVDGRAMARHRGGPAPPDPHSYAEATLAEARLAEATPAEATALAAVRRCATAFGRGAGALVNAFDPEVVTIGGLAVPLQEVAPAQVLAGYTAGLMAFHRQHPPPLRVAALGERAPVLGAAEVAFDALLTEPGLADWSRQLLARPRRAVGQ